MNQKCKCEEILKIWNKQDKTKEEQEYLSIVVKEQFKKVNEYYIGNVKIYVLQCKDCGTIIKVPHI